MTAFTLCPAYDSRHTLLEVVTPILNAEPAIFTALCVQGWPLGSSWPELTIGTRMWVSASSNPVIEEALDDLGLSTK